MRKFILSVAALAVATPVAVTFTPVSADAQTKTYKGKDYYVRCKKSGGTTGALLGGAGGAVVGSAVGGTGATVAGAALGARGATRVSRRGS